MAWRTTPVGTDTDYALDLALTILAGGRMSRLQRRMIYDGDLAAAVSATNDSRIESGGFWLFIEAAQGAHPDEIEAVVVEEIARLAAGDVSPDEIKRAKAMMRASEAFDSETASDLAEEIGEWAVDFDWRMAFDNGARHAKVTKKDLAEAVASYLSPERCVTGWCLPQSEALAAGKAPAQKKKKRAARGARRSPRA